MVKVPVVWEVSPRWGPVAVAAGASFFVSLIGLGLVLQDLRDEASMGFGGDEYFGQHQGVCWSAGGLLALVLLDSSRLCSGRSGAWQQV